MMMMMTTTSPPHYKTERIMDDRHEDDRIHVSARIRPALAENVRKCIDNDEASIRILTGRNPKNYVFDDVLEDACTQVCICI